MEPMKALRIILIIRRYRQMAKNSANVIKSAGLGLAAGIMFGFVGSVMLKDNKKCKRKAVKAIDSVENFVDGIRDMFTS